MNEEMTLANEKLDEPPVCTLALWLFMSIKYNPPKRNSVKKQLVL